MFFVVFTPFLSFPLTIGSTTLALHSQGAYMVGLMPFNQLYVTFETDNVSGTDIVEYTDSNDDSECDGEATYGIVDNESQPWRQLSDMVDKMRKAREAQKEATSPSSVSSVSSQAMVSLDKSTDMDEITSQGTSQGTSQRHKKTSERTSSDHMTSKEVIRKGRSADRKKPTSSSSSSPSPSYSSSSSSSSPSYSSSSSSSSSLPSSSSSLTGIIPRHALLGNLHLPVPKKVIYPQEAQMGEGDLEPHIRLDIRERSPLEILAACASPFLKTNYSLAMEQLLKLSGQSNRSHIKLNTKSTHLLSSCSKVFTHLDKVNGGRKSKRKTMLEVVSEEETSSSSGKVLVSSAKNGDSSKKKRSLKGYVYTDESIVKDIIGSQTSTIEDENDVEDEDQVEVRERSSTSQHSLRRRIRKASKYEGIIGGDAYGKVRHKKQKDTQHDISEVVDEDNEDEDEKRMKKEEEKEENTFPMVIVIAQC